MAAAVQTTTNTYDKLNQLIQTVTPNGTSIVNIYNGEGMRVAKATNGVIRRYLYEGDKVVLHTDVDGKCVVENVQGTNLILRQAGGQIGYFFYNGHGDVTGIISTGKEILGDVKDFVAGAAYGTLAVFDGIKNAASGVVATVAGDATYNFKHQQ